MAPTLGSPHFWTSLVFGNQLPCDAATMRHIFPLRMLTLRQDGSSERPKAFGNIFGTSGDPRHSTIAPSNIFGSLLGTQRGWRCQRMTFYFR